MAWEQHQRAAIADVRSAPTALSVDAANIKIITQHWLLRNNFTQQPVQHNGTCWAAERAAQHVPFSRGDLAFSARPWVEKEAEVGGK